MRHRLRGDSPPRYLSRVTWSQPRAAVRARRRPRERSRCRSSRSGGQKWRSCSRWTKLRARARLRRAALRQSGGRRLRGGVHRGGRCGRGARRPRGGVPPRSRARRLMGSLAAVRATRPVASLSAMLCLRLARSVACRLPTMVPSASAAHLTVGLRGVQSGALAAHSSQESRELVVSEGDASALVSLGCGWAGCRRRGVAPAADVPRAGHGHGGEREHDHPVATIVLSAFMLRPRVESDAHTTLTTRGGAFLHPAATRDSVVRGARWTR